MRFIAGRCRRAAHVAATLAFLSIPHAWAADVQKDAGTVRGAALYATVCAACHDAGGARTPQKAVLALMTPDSILRSMTHGVMRAQATGLNDDDRLKVAEYIAGRKRPASSASPRACAAGVSPFDFAEPPPFAGWGLTPGRRHAVTAQAAGVDRGNVGKLTLRWSMAFPGVTRARAQPAVAGGAVFAGSEDGAVHALDRATGCARWTFQASAKITGGIVVAPWPSGDAKAKPLLYFGDVLGNLYAVDALTGQRVWKTKPDAHPNATIAAAPVLFGDVLYVATASLEQARAADPAYACCSFRGSLSAYAARTGQRRWQAFMVAAPASGMALWSGPAIDERRGRLYLTAGGAYNGISDTAGAVVALDIRTGQVAWRYRDDEAEPERDVDAGAGAVFAHAASGRDYVLAAQGSGMLRALNPDTGALVWSTAIGRGGDTGGIGSGIAVVGDRVFVPVADGWAGDGAPGLYALDLGSGNYLWKVPAEDVCGGKPACRPGYAGAVTATPDLVFAGSEDGHLRAFDAATGVVVWDVDTTNPIATPGGAVAKGGAIGGTAAPIVWRGDVIVMSGNDMDGGMAGNAMLVFGTSPIP